MDCTSLTELKCFYHEAAKLSLLNAFATLISKKHIVNLLEVFQDSRALLLKLHTLGVQLLGMPSSKN